MSGFESDRGELDRSRAFFQDPGSYTTFDRTSKGRRRIITCADPRDEQADALHTAVQTVGGGGGVGHDASLAKTAMTGRLVTRSRALEEDAQVRMRSVLDCHPDCRFEGSFESILEEEINPSDFTLDAIARWADHYGVRDVSDSRARQIRDAAQRKLDYVQRYGQSDVLSEVDRLYPEYANVVQMRGENNAGLYVVNHHPHLGLNRQLEHREVGLEVQAYCESLGGSVEDLTKLRVSTEERDLRLTALLSRAAAGRTLLGAQHPGMEYIEVMPIADAPFVEVNHTPGP